jgi:hypothetical protein
MFQVINKKYNKNNNQIKIKNKKISSANFVRTKNGYSMIDSSQIRLNKAYKLIQLVSSKLSKKKKIS